MCANDGITSSPEVAWIAQRTRSPAHKTALMTTLSNASRGSPGGWSQIGEARYRSPKRPELPTFWERLLGKSSAPVRSGAARPPAEGHDGLALAREGSARGLGEGR